MNPFTLAYRIFPSYCRTLGTHYNMYRLGMRQYEWLQSNYDLLSTTFKKISIHFEIQVKDMK